MKGAIFGNGLPTQIDVDALEKKFGQLKPGDVLAYADISACIGVKKDSHRWRTVVESYRKKQQRDNNTILRARPDIQAFVVLDEAGKVEHVASKFKSGFRLIRRGGAVVKRIDRGQLTPEQRMKADHAQNVSAMIDHARLVAAKPLTALPHAG